MPKRKNDLFGLSGSLFSSKKGGNFGLFDSPKQKSFDFDLFGKQGKQDSLFGPDMDISFGSFNINEARKRQSSQRQALIPRSQTQKVFSGAFSPENVSVVPQLPGVYEFFDGAVRRIYIGVSHRLKHRLQSYYQDDNFSEHPTKKRLRSEIRTFKAEVMPMRNARIREHRLKGSTKFNFS